MSRATNYQAQVLQNLERGQVRKTGSTDYSKRQQRDLLMFQKGVSLGADLMKSRIHNSVAGLDYGAAYYVPPVVASGVLGGVADSPAVDGADPLAHSESDTLPA